jgi:hypothetical protein
LRINGSAVFAINESIQITVPANDTGALAAHKRQEIAWSIAPVSSNCTGT